MDCRETDTLELEVYESSPNVTNLVRIKLAYS